MFKYFRLIKDLFLINPGLFWKTLFWGLLISWVGWNYLLKRPFYQVLYGTPTHEKLQIWDKDSFIEIPEQKIIPLNIGGYDIEVQAIKRFETTARVIYVDRYTKLGTWYRSHEGAALYDAVVPQDISLATGVVGRKHHCFKFTHGYRYGGGFSKYKCGKRWWEDFPNYSDDISNNHSIAASPNVQRGLDILKQGDIVHIEGYLMYWNGTGNLRYQRFESAIVPNQMSEQLLGGQKAGLCRQLLITKITVDGYTFE